MNNNNIAFDDVTEDCSLDGAVTEDGTHCAAAEVFITPSLMEDNPTAAGLMRPHVASIDFYPTTTAGVRLQYGIGLRRASLDISTNVCWYVGGTF